MRFFRLFRQLDVRADFEYSESDGVFRLKRLKDVFFYFEFFLFEQ